MTTATQEEVSLESLDTRLGLTPQG